MQGQKKTSIKRCGKNATDKSSQNDIENKRQFGSRSGPGVKKLLRHPGLFELLALDPDGVIAHAGHPQTPRQRALDWPEVVLGARVNQAQEALDDRRRSAMALKVD